MNEKIASLIRLQELDIALDEFLQTQSRLDPERQKLKESIHSLQTQFDQAKTAYTQAQVEKKNLELDIESKEQAVRKHTSELNGVKSNDAYKALLTEIDGAKKAKTALEDRVLEIMEQMDQLQKDSKEAEKRFQQEKSVMEKQMADLDEEEKRLKGQYEQKKKERDEFAQTLPEVLRSQYESIRRGRKGVKVIVPVKGNICGGCQMILPPSVVNDVVKGADIIVCESCTRILYMPPKAPSAVPQENVQPVDR